MVRNRGKKALYEVMSKARVKQEQGKITEQPKPIRPEKKAPVPDPKETSGVPKSSAKWWRKPRIVQFNAGRIEFSMPYQIAVVLILGLIFVVIAAYRLGQSSYPAEQQPQVTESGPLRRVTESIRPVEKASANTMQPQAPAEDNSNKTENVEEITEPAEPAGSNVIVLVQFDRLADLSPVQAYFSEHGIETEIKLEGSRYFLQTIQKYDNPSRPGTDGYDALQNIKKIGKGYKAPPGYETFASNLFQDAYGKRAK